MPTQKDLKRLVRSRMAKTGEAYTAARLQLLTHAPIPDHAAAAGMSDAAVTRTTGRTWAEWVRRLDAVHSASKPHGQIVAYVASLGTSNWWSQMVTVGYERIRGLRDRGQRRGGGYAASKSRTVAVPIEALYAAFADPRTRRRWLTVTVTVRSAAPPRRLRLTWADGSLVQCEFTAKGTARSAVYVRQERLPDRAAVGAMKAAWTAHLDRLSVLLS